MATLPVQNSLIDKSTACYINVSGIFYARTLMIYGSVPPGDSVMGSQHSTKSESLSLGSFATGKAGPFFFGLNSNFGKMQNSKTLPSQNPHELIEELKQSIKSNSTDRFFAEYDPKEIQSAFMELHGHDRPFEQMLSVCDSLFDLLDDQDKLPHHLKVVLWHLYKCYSMYKALLINQNAKKFQS